MIKKKKAIEYYEQEIKKRDKQIEELHEKIKILLKTSLRASEELEEIKQKLKDFSKKFK